MAKEPIPPPRHPQEPSFAAVVESFSDSNAALREFVETVGSVLDEKTRGVFEQHSEGLLPLLLALSKLRPDEFTLPKEAAASIEGDVQIEARGDDLTLSVSGKRATQLSDAMQALQRRSIHHNLLYRSALTVLVSSAEWFLAQLIRLHYQRHPDSVGLKERLLSYEEIAVFSSLDDARRYLVDLKIEEIMRSSVEEWLRFLASQLKLSMSYLEPHKARLTEIFQRRNLLVHNNGVVNATYLAKVSPDLHNSSKVGDVLEVSPSYLQSAIDVIELSFTLIAAELWKRVLPDDDLRPAELIKIGFERLKAEKWVVAEGLSCFVMKDKNGTEREQMIGQCNYWQCKKWRGDFDQTREDIQSADFSAKDELFQLVRFALLDDGPMFFDLLPKVVEQKKLGAEELDTWPIFRELRKNEEYARFRARQALGGGSPSSAEA